MYKAKLYSNGNRAPKEHAAEILERYKTNWQKSGAKIIDIGCGDGGVTVEVLKKYLPSDFEEFVGCDISEAMIRFAKAQYKDSRIQFMLQDIEDDFPDTLLGRFDYVFSFYALHWMRNIEFAFTNVYKLLKEDGVCLLTFLGNCPIFDVYRVMVKDKKWCNWLRDAERYVSPYHDSKDPVTEITRTLEKIGFKDIHVTYDDRSFRFKDANAYRDTMTAILPFKLPKSLEEDFLAEYMKTIIELGDNSGVDESMRNRTLTYKTPVIYAKK